MRNTILHLTIIFLLTPYTLWSEGITNEPCQLASWKEALCHSWKYDKCEILAIPYPAESKEREDQLILRKDMTFSQVDDGTFSTGTWRICLDKSSIMLTDAYTQEVTEFTIEKLSEDRLVLRLREPWKFDVFMYFDTKPNFAI